MTRGWPPLPARAHRDWKKLLDAAWDDPVGRSILLPILHHMELIGYEFVPGRERPLRFMVELQTKEPSIRRDLHSKEIGKTLKRLLKETFLVDGEFQVSDWVPTLNETREKALSMRGAIQDAVTAGDKKLADRLSKEYLRYLRGS